MGDLVEPQFGGDDGDLCVACELRDAIGGLLIDAEDYVLAAKSLMGDQAPAVATLLRHALAELDEAISFLLPDDDELDDDDLDGGA